MDKRGSFIVLMLILSVFLVELPPISARTALEITDIVEDGYIEFDNPDYDRFSSADVIRIYYNSHYRGYIEWNISSIPSNAIIDKVSLKIKTGETAYGDVDIYAMENQPSVSSNSIVYADAWGGDKYYTTPATSNNTWYTYEMGTQAATDLQTKINGNLTWFAVGMYSAPNSNKWQANETGNIPTLLVDYHFSSDAFYVFDGVYYENGTYMSSGLNIAVHELSETTTFYLDGAPITKYYSEPPIQFTWSLPGGGSRRIYTYNETENIYIYTPNDDYASYSFYIKDYSGSVGSGDTYLESLRVVNGIERVVERVLIWDTVNAVPLTLTIGQIYILQARLSDDTIYRFGYFTPGSDPTPTLTISGIPFSDQAHYVGEHISVEATRPNATHIQTAYENLLEDTTDLLVEICYMNGTQVWNDTTLNDDIIFNWYGAGNETDYLVNFEAYSEFYGDISYSKALVGEKTDITDPPDLDAVLGSGVRLMISIFIIYMGFIIFSAYTAILGVFSGLTITYVLNFMNFIPIPIPWTILHALMGLLIMWALAGGNK